MLDISFQAVRHLAGMIGWESPAAVADRERQLRAELEYQTAVAADAQSQFVALEAAAKKTASGLKKEYVAQTAEVRAENKAQAERLIELELELQELRADYEALRAALAAEEPQPESDPWAQDPEPPLEGEVEE